MSAQSSRLTYLDPQNMSIIAYSLLQVLDNNSTYFADVQVRLCSRVIVKHWALGDFHHMRTGKKHGHDAST